MWNLSPKGLRMKPVLIRAINVTAAIAAASLFGVVVFKPEPPDPDAQVMKRFARARIETTRDMIRRKGLECAELIGIEFWGGSNRFSCRLYNGDYAIYRQIPNTMTFWKVWKPWE